MIKMEAEAKDLSAKQQKISFSMNCYDDTRIGLDKSANNVAPDPNDYIQKARVTRAVPPKPANDPLQFVQLKPCSNLALTAQEQLKRTELVKKNNLEKKEEPEEWQCNLDSWKSSRRKRVEHIIERVVEVKKFEREDYNTNRRKSTTFSEIVEKRGSKGIQYLPIYDDDDNDLSDLGLTKATPSVQPLATESDHPEVTFKINQSNSNEYTYEGAIESYKSRVSKAGNMSISQSNANPQSPEMSPNYGPCRYVGEEPLENKEHEKDNNEREESVNQVGVLKRKEIFEKEITPVPKSQELDHRDLDILTAPNERRQSIESNIFNDLKKRISVFEIDEMNTSKSKEVQFMNTENKSEAAVDAYKKVYENDVLSSTEQDQTGCALNIETHKLQLDENQNVGAGYKNSKIDTSDISYTVSSKDIQNNNSQMSSFYEDEHNVILSGENHENTTGNDERDDGSILDDALESAFQVIDDIGKMSPQNIYFSPEKHIYQNISKSTDDVRTDVLTSMVDGEPYYQVPKSHEPYYEVPKTKQIPLYENIDMIYSDKPGLKTANENIISCNKNLKPPKEKPPPPPLNISNIEILESAENKAHAERANDESKHESRKKEHYEYSVYSAQNIKTKDYSSDCEIALVEPNGYQKYIEDESAKSDEQIHTIYAKSPGDNDDMIDGYFSDRMELNNMAGRNVQGSLQPIYYDANDRIKRSIGQILLKNEQSMVPPPAKPLRSYFSTQSQQDYKQRNTKSFEYQWFSPNSSNSGLTKTKSSSLNDNQIAYGNHYDNIDCHGLCGNEQSLSNTFLPSSNTTITSESSHWSPFNGPNDTCEFDDLNFTDIHAVRNRSLADCVSLCRPERHRLSHSDDSDDREIRQTFENRMQHHSNIAASSTNSKNENRKSLPESVIQTITQRVQSLGIGMDKRWPSDIRNIPRLTDEDNESKYSIFETFFSNNTDEKILSVSGKKKCSHCKKELGRGAAMVIESLGLLYHIDCFKCCVCHIRLGDGLKGTDVRVRKYKLHCRNCFSSEDGVKFSCV